MLRNLDQRLETVRSEVDRSLPAQLQAAAALQGPGAPADSVPGSMPVNHIKLRSQSGRLTKQVGVGGCNAISIVAEVF
jgi:hypothetical protein